MFDACVDFTGTPPAASPNSLSKQIRATAKMLWVRDQIMYFPPGKNGGAEMCIRDRLFFISGTLPVQSSQKHNQGPFADQKG